MSITARGSRRFEDETLLAAPSSIVALRDQHHAAARSGVRPADHFHDHDTVAREQHESGDSVERREKSTDQFIADTNDLDRPQRDDQIEQSGGRSRNANLTAA